MADTRSNYLQLYEIGSTSDNVGVHMITNYNYNIALLDAYIAAHDVESVAFSDGAIVITSLDGTTYSADISDMFSGVVADAFDSTVDYAVGDYCIYEGAFYVCTTAHSGDWDSSNFTATTIAEVLASMLSSIDGKADAATTLAGYGITDAYTNSEVDTLLSSKADAATTLAGYGIADAYTSTETDSAISTAINALDVSDSATAGSYVTAVSETNGEISVTKEAADTTPTEDSTKMVTSGGVYSAIDTVKEALTNLNDTVVQNGAHNLLPLTLANLQSASTSGTWSDNVYTLNGITFTVNLDDNDNVESILVDGTATGTSAITVGEIELDNGTYYINGTPSGASVAGYSTLIQVYNGSSWTDVYCLSQNSFTVTNRKIKVYVARIASGTTVSGVYYYPMIRRTTDSDTTYTPYAMTNQQLTDEITWKQLYSGTLTAGSSATLSDSLSNYKEVLVIYHVGGLRSFYTPIQAVTSSYSFGTNEYVSSSYNGTTSLKFTSDTTISMTELSTTGWSTNGAVEVYAR